MKTRNGFVSNSSSSSFIIQWQCNVKDIANGDAKAAIERLMECSSEDCITEIVENTQVLNEDRNIFETTFFTPMRNCAEDYGKAASVFYLTLDLEKRNTGIANYDILFVKEDGDPF
jgi:hypothetical protein